MLSRLKTVSPAILVGGVVLIVVVSAVFLIISKFQTVNTLYLGDGTAFDAQIAYTQTARVKGYGGVDAISEKDAMIFAFPSDDTWKITMRDMNFPLDIVWLDSDKKVIHIVKNASPDGGENTVFTPNSEARYVVEMAAGSVATKKIKIGRSAVFDIKTEDIK